MLIRPSGFLPRLLALAGPALLAAGLATATAGVAAQPSSVRFSIAPQQAFPGRLAVVGVSVRPARVRCSLSVRYADGKTQPGLKAVVAVKGRALWKWRVSDTAAAGPAKLRVSCGRAQASRAFTIAGSESKNTDFLPPKISVQKQGFSIRPKSFGTDVSYGVILTNTSADADALDVTVLVNFVQADNVLIGSDGTRIAVMPSGGTFMLGGSLHFPGAAPVARLEVVIQVGARHDKEEHPVPALANVRVVPSPHDPGWVGSVEGEVINDHPSWTLTRTRMSIVVFDAAGNILGGGTGYASASLPPGTRQFFKAASGFDAIRIEKAASAQVTLEPSYELPPTPK